MVYGLTIWCRSKVAQPAVHLMLITAQRYSADGGKSAGFIDMVTPGVCNLVDAAAKLGVESAGDLETFRTKYDLYHDLYRTLTQSSKL